MIDVLRMGFTKKHLLKMTKEERGAFLLFGYTSNQAGVLWKVIIASLNREPPDPVDARVSAAQTQVLVKAHDQRVVPSRGSCVMPEREGESVLDRFAKLGVSLNGLVVPGRSIEGVLAWHALHLVINNEGDETFSSLPRPILKNKAVASSVMAQPLTYKATLPQMRALPDLI